MQFQNISQCTSDISSMLENYYFKNTGSSETKTETISVDGKSNIELRIGMFGYIKLDITLSDDSEYYKTFMKEEWLRKIIPGPEWSYSSLDLSISMGLVDDVVSLHLKEKEHTEINELVNGEKFDYGISVSFLKRSRTMHFDYSSWPANITKELIPLYAKRIAMTIDESLKLAE